MKKFFNYICIIWEGNDGKPSLRRLMAIAGCVSAFKYVEAGSPNEMILGVLFGFVFSMMGLTTYQNVSQVKKPEQ